LQEAGTFTGRSYHNLRLLSYAGLAVFRSEGEREHARAYRLRELHQKRARTDPGAREKAATSDLALVKPLPSPAEALPTRKTSLG
jgi:hypothetical protein